MCLKVAKVSYYTLICVVLVTYYLTFPKNQHNTSEKRQHSTNSIGRSKYLVDKLKCKSLPLEWRILQHGKHWLIQNLISGSLSRSIGCADAITYVTNSDYTFLKTLGTLVQRWNAPISIALFAPGYDFNDTLTTIQYVRNCIPESLMVREFATFHVYFPEKHLPERIPHSEYEALNWPYNCDLLPPYVGSADQMLYRKSRNLTYPINVGRNIARRAVNTYFVFTSDIELFPNPGLGDKFLDMIADDIEIVIGSDPGEEQNSRVFPLSVFELAEDATLPNTKLELISMYENNTAITFHANLCSWCHRFPYKEEWLKLTKVNKMSILGIIKREGWYRVWEPFYISDNKEPMYDERITWEGQSNKRIQGYAMCLLNYSYYVLNDGFLVHTPGIKKFILNSRILYVKETNDMIKKIYKREYRKLFGRRWRCDV